FARPQVSLAEPRVDDFAKVIEARILAVQVERYRALVRCGQLCFVTEFVTNPLAKVGRAAIFLRPQRASFTPGIQRRIPKDQLVENRSGFRFLEDSSLELPFSVFPAKKEAQGFFRCTPRTAPMQSDAAVDGDSI